MFLLFHLFRLSVGFKIGTIATIIFSVEDEAAFKACTGNRRDKKKGNKTFEAAHRSKINSNIRKSVADRP